MKLILKKSVLVALFGAFLISSTHYASVTAEGAEVNVFKLVQNVVCRPMFLSTLGTALSVAASLICYVRYHRRCDWRANLYNQVNFGISQDLSSEVPKYQGSLNKMAKEQLRDKALGVLIDEFYKTIKPESGDGGAIVPCTPAEKSKDINLYLFGGNGNYIV